jgi:hypothetical protein
MANVTDVLGSIIHGGGKGLLNVKIPSFSLSQGFNYEGVKSLGGIVGSVVDSAQNLLQGARLAYCAGKMLTNPGMMLNVLSTLGNSVIAAATEMASRLAGLINGQITQALSQISGTIQGLVGNIFGFLGSIIDLYKSIVDLVDAISNIGFGNWGDFMAEEDCEYIFAAMAACMLNKFLGSKLQDLERKISSKIIETGSALNSSIADGLADVNSVSSYIERETFMMEKATKQINGINNLIS